MPFATPRHSRPSQTRSRGFTLLEMMLVVVIMGVMAGMVVGGLGGIKGLQIDTGIEEMRRLIRRTRATAMATGEPSAMVIDPQSNTIELLRLDAETSAVVPMFNALGDDERRFVASDRWADLIITSAVGGDGKSGRTAIWFAFNGDPHLRDEDGLYLADFSEDATIQVAGTTIIVRAQTGLVE